MVRYLDWDSNFFGLRIGRIDIGFEQCVDKEFLDICNIQNDYDLIYLFSNQNLRDIPNNINLVDVKTVYFKQLSVEQGNFANISVYRDTLPNKELYKLVLISGKHSRFKLDKRFPSNSYERLYKKWIEQSTNGNMADKVFVHQTNGCIQGMATVSLKDNVANIGLIAVNEEFQGKGIGTLLIKAIENFLVTETTIKIIKVITQWNNTNARHLYEKNGFEVESKSYIYHWWL